MNHGKNIAQIGKVEEHWLSGFYFRIWIYMVKLESGKTREFPEEYLRCADAWRQNHCFDSKYSFIW